MIVKTAVITGGTRGIGHSIALDLCANGVAVVLNYASLDHYAEEALRQCRDVGRAWKVKADVAKREQATHLTAQAIQLLGSIDVLVNCAGLNRDGPALSMSEEDWDRVIDVNLKGTFLMCQSVAARMMQQPQGGHIINVAATTGISGRANGANYCAAKAGVITLTKCLAIELGPRVRVNCVLPGFTRTEETARRFNLPEREHEEIVRRKIPLGRIGEPQEVARVVRFLVQEDVCINGQKIIVDGGEYMY